MRFAQLFEACGKQEHCSSCRFGLRLLVIAYTSIENGR